MPNPNPEKENSWYFQDSPSPQPPLTEFSILSVGQNKFLKVYHSTNPQSHPSEQSHQQQQQPPPQHHQQPHQQQQQQQPTFNSYELFSSNNTLISPPIRFTESVDARQQQFEKNESNTTNMIINQLVTNLSGQSYSPFGAATTTENVGMPVKSVIGGSNYASNTGKKSNDIQLPVTNGNPPEVKKLVAEVRPMLYSDVLSKNVENSARNEKNSIQNVEPLVKQSKLIGGPKSNLSGGIKNTTFDEKNDFKSNKKSENILKPEEVLPQSIKDPKKATKVEDVDKKKTTKRLSQPELGNKNSKKNQFCDGNSKKRNREDDNNKSSNSQKSNDGFYVAAAKSDNYEKPQKNSGISQQNYNVTGMKKSRGRIPTASVTLMNNNSGSNRSERKRSQKHRKDIKYELISKFVEKWIEYSVKILTWLFYLIYDVVVLSFGIAWDRINIYAATITVFSKSMLSDIKKNYGRPSSWLKNSWKKFDLIFKKNSKFAFWRYFSNSSGKRKSNLDADNKTEFYKNGRLPQTGEEAMFELLNCKGKDAYSILGVKPDSTQEQIRKHYKKIAVLVHPDKNKQPGAEEAFKVLHRSFELIGEPENRKQYDQSLIEALNAEKAWSELNDLLAQLQTKITEATNTIRCSSCGLRHPRKLVANRPHYAARECFSCKIRHSAREGDIWAETYYFGLRWKYLALMDGKCYDITEWANCQKGALSHLQPNSHIVQYRIVRGGGGQQQQQQNSNNEKEKSKREQPSEPSLDDFLDNLYSGQNPQQNASRRRRRN